MRCACRRAPAAATDHPFPHEVRCCLPPHTPCARRWPRTLTASLRAFGAGRDHTFTSRSAAFPANSLAQQHARQRVQQAQQAQQVQQQQQQQPGQEATQQLGLLEEAVVCGLEALIHQAASACPATATVVELRLTATSFQAAAAATAAAPITRFFAAAQPAHQEQQQQQESQQQQQESEQEQQEENEGQPAGQPGHAEASSQQGASGPQHQQPAGTAPPGSPVLRGTSASSSGGGSGGEAGRVDLSGIDVAEQERILKDIQQQQRRQQEQQLQGQQPRAGAGSKRQRMGSSPHDSKQPKISAFLRR